MTLSNITLALAAISNALIAGLFYSYSCSVNPGLQRLPDAGYLSAMQSINRAILNPVFFLSFMGTLLLLPLASWLAYDGTSKRFVCLAMATLLYVVGTFGVTLFGNVPLNEALENFRIEGASVKDLYEARLAFERPWNNLHHVRSLCSVIALVLVILACLMRPMNASVSRN
jgi:uncharacterized membrane protein